MPDEVRIEFPELKQKIRRLKDMDRDQLQRIDRALFEAASEIIALAKEIVPVDDGHLRNSLKVERGRGGRSESEMELVAGGPSAPYAFAVHEAVEGNLSSSFMPPSWRNLHSIRWSTPGTGPKYLERPLRAHQGRIKALLDDAISDALRGIR